MHPQRANNQLQGLDRRALTVGRSHIRSPQPTWSPALALFHQLWIYMVRKKHSGKADQSWIYMVRKKHLGKVDQSTLVSGGTEHA